MNDITIKEGRIEMMGFPELTGDIRFILATSIGVDKNIDHESKASYLTKRHEDGNVYDDKLYEELKSRGFTTPRHFLLVGERYIETP